MKVAYCCVRDGRIATPDMNDNPLGKNSAWPQVYAPSVLCGIARADSRAAVLQGRAVPFHGEDVWNAWELTWLDTGGKPVAATAEIRVPADSPQLIESKSLKLYLNSLAMSRYPGSAAVATLIAADLGAIAGVPVAVSVMPLDDGCEQRLGTLPGECIDGRGGEFASARVDPSQLGVEDGPLRDEALHSHLLRSNCPVTNQPDMGSILIRYRGRPIDRGALLRYLVSYRLHNDFHEACVERIFLDIQSRCETERLTVYARYNRRGGLDINPFRSDFEPRADNARLWRQ